jgi:hypothetical protein
MQLINQLKYMEIIYGNYVWKFHLKIVYGNHIWKLYMKISWVPWGAAHGRAWDPGHSL